MLTRRARKRRRYRCGRHGRFARSRPAAATTAKRARGRQETEDISVTIADIEAARRTIAGQVLRTPMLPAPKLSALTGADVFVKYENLQVTNSFKDRGAFNKLASLLDEKTMAGLNYQVDGPDKKEPADVARAFLEQSGLLTK